MQTEKKPAKRIYTYAAAIGLALGSMGIAAAATTPAVASEAQDNEATKVKEIESSSDKEVESSSDKDHQNEGEETGNN